MTQKEFQKNLVALNTKNKNLKLENSDLQSFHQMLNRQIQRYKNSIAEIEIIIEKYDVVNRQDQERVLREMLQEVRVEVENVQKEQVKDEESMQSPIK